MTPLRSPLPRAAAFAVLLPLLAAACASAEKRMEQGVRLEQEGRPADAATRYVDALRKDPSLTTARVRLQIVGDAAVAEHLRAVSLLESAERLDEAADELMVAEDLARRAAAVGVRLATPADLARRREDLFGRAAEEALAAARELTRGGRWDEADRRLARALDRYEPAPEQRDALVRARADAHLGAAEAELARGGFRAAYERVERLKGLADEGAAAQWLDPALRLQEEALRRGTRRVAVLPVGIDRAQRDRLPEDFGLALNDALEADHWRRPPLFVDVMDAVATRGVARRHGYGRQTVSTAEAAAMGRELRADYVLVAAVDSVARWTGEVTRVRRPARTREGTDTAYTALQGRERLRVRVRYFLVDPQMRRVVQEGVVSAESGAPLRRGEYAGDWRTLTLNREDRDLFDGDREAARERELVRETVRELAPDLAREVFARLERESR